MKRILMISIVISLCTGGAAVAGRRRSVVMPPQDELTIEFVMIAGALNAGVLDLGAIAHSGRDPRRTIVQQTIGVRVTQRPQRSSGTAALRVWLEGEDGRCIVRIDGRALGTAPMVVASRVTLGVVSAHRIEIEVPASAPEGPLLTGIRWEAATN
jgi:hypothetical protein